MSAKSSALIALPDGRTMDVLAKGRRASAIFSAAMNAPVTATEPSMATTRFNDATYDPATDSRGALAHGIEDRSFVEDVNFRFVLRGQPSSFAQYIFSRTD